MDIRLNIIYTSDIYFGGAILHIVFIGKREIISVMLVLLITAVSIIYTKSIKEGALRTFVNNENETPICRVDTSDRRISLTFDTGWGDDQHVQDILYVLKRYNLKATFFVVGAWADRYPEMVRAISGDGHEIGNHSTTHVKMTDIPKSDITKEIKDTSEKIKQLTGKDMHAFRAPFGEYNSSVIAAARSLKYYSIKWDVDSQDWKGFSASKIADRVLKEAGNGSIILFHCNADSTSESLPLIIEKLRDDGYTFVTVSELLFKENYYIDSTGCQKSLK